MESSEEPAGQTQDISVDGGGYETDAIFGTLFH